MTKETSRYYPPEWTDHECSQVDIQDAIFDWIIANIGKHKGLSPGELNYELAQVIRHVPSPNRRDYHVNQ